MEIKVKESEKIKLILGEDKTLIISKPSMGALLRLEESLAAAQKEKTGSAKAIIDWGEALGIPREVICGMDEDVYAMLITDIREACEKKVSKTAGSSSQG